MQNRKTVPVSQTICVDVWYDQTSRLWAGAMRNRETDQQIGEAWWGTSREEALVWGGVHFWIEYRAEQSVS